MNYLQSLEAESIHVLREAVATFNHPVMLYSAGKDSCVMMHLAMKAFYPGKPPFPFLHVDTTWKFKEMISFRDKMMRQHGTELLVHVNHDGLERKVNPFSYAADTYTHVMKTEALRQAVAKHGFDAMLGGARRD